MLLAKKLLIYVTGLFSPFVVIVVVVYTVSFQEMWSSLMVASQNGHVEVVEMLLQHGATVDLQNNVYNASIHCIGVS